MARYLSVVERAYRATVEEQDDPGVWFTQALLGAGAEVALLLTSDAVCYALPGQDATGLSLGTRAVRVAPRLCDDLGALIAKGAPVYAVAEDAAVRGLRAESLLPGVKLVAREQLARLLAQYERVIQW